MFRKLSILFVIGLLAFTTACSSTTSAVSNAAANATGSNVVATANASSCPTSNTRSFAKTRFVADVALAGGAFKRWIYTPAKNGSFQKGAHGRITALVKAAAAGLFVVNRLNAAKTNAEANPTLCKVLVTPMAKFSSAVSGLIGKAKSGSINASDVNSSSGYLDALHGASSQGGAPFTDNLSANP